MTENRDHPIKQSAERWHAQPAGAVVDRLGTSESRGLAGEEAERRLAEYGPNRLPEPKRRGPLVRLLLQFHNPLIYVLLVASVVTFLLDHDADAAVILGVVIINALIGFVQEGKAEQALEAVRAMLASKATVLLPDREIQVSGAGYAPDGGFERDGRSLDPRRDEGLLGLARCALLCNDAHLSRDDNGDWTPAASRHRTHVTRRSS